MKISKIFNLNKTQPELDFVDIHTDRDTPLFLDPMFINKGQDQWSIEASHTISNFFQTIIGLIQANEIDEARMLFNKLKEPKETFLGLSPTGDGTGVTQSNSDEIFRNILNSQAIQSGLLEDLEDCRIFVKNFDKDRLSDMTTNIIRKQLIEYTIDQCNLHSMPLTSNIASGHYWDVHTSDWKQGYDSALITPDNKKILLVPKRIVSFADRYTSRDFYQHFVLNFLRDEELRQSGPLVQVRKKSKDRFVTKKSVREKNDGSKLNLTMFARQHPEVFQKFKGAIKGKPENPIRNEEISDEYVSIIDLCNHLIDRLNILPKGNDDADEYHKLVTSILAILMYPTLFAPKTEVKIHDGRKRIDIVFQNAADKGIFHQLAQHPLTNCNYVLAECKNYSKEVANPELDQLSGRFSGTRSRVGLLLFRDTDNMDVLLKRCKDTYKDQRGLIIPVKDSDLIVALKAHLAGESEPMETRIKELVREIQMA